MTGTVGCRAVAVGRGEAGVGRRRAAACNTGTDGAGRREAGVRAAAIGRREHVTHGGVVCRAAPWSRSVAAESRATGENPIRCHVVVVNWARRTRIKDTLRSNLHRIHALHRPAAQVHHTAATTSRTGRGADDAALVAAGDTVGAEAQEEPAADADAGGRAAAPAREGREGAVLAAGDGYAHPVEEVAPAAGGGVPVGTAIDDHDALRAAAGPVDAFDEAHAVRVGRAC